MRTVTVGAAEIRAAVSMTEAIDAVRRGFADLAAGAFEIPTRTSLGDGRFLVMAAHHRPTASAMIKTLSLNFDRRPAIAGTVVWSETGRLDHLDDAEVIRRSLDDPEKFSALFDRYVRLIHRYAARRLGTQVADDIVAETFLVAFRRRTLYDVRRTLARPWLYGIATTLIARYHRDEGRHYRALERTGIDPLPEPMAEGVVTRVAKAVVDRPGQRP